MWQLTLVPAEVKRPVGMISGATGLYVWVGDKIVRMITDGQRNPVIAENSYRLGIRI
jgi:hypothetical protein